MRKGPEETTVTCPFTVVIDGREKAPYRFTGLTSDADQKKKPIVVTTEWGFLKSGDYTIKGFEEVVSVERKSMADLFSTLGQHRERFEAEHVRLAAMKRAAVVIEATWYDILHWPPEQSKLNPKTVWRTSISWLVRYGIPWVTVEDRRLAEVFTFRFLEKAWKEFGDDKTGR